jgi:Flp pilus assembly protein TadD
MVSTFRPDPRLMSQPPTLADVLDQAEALLRAGAADRAVAVYRTALLADPDHRAALHGLARSLRALSRAAEADAVLLAALERYPDAPELHVDRAEILSDWGRIDEAVAAAERAAGLSRGDPRPAALLAGLLDRQGETDRALAVLASLDMEGAGRASAEALTVLSRLRRRAGDPDAALSAAEKAAAIAASPRAGAEAQVQRALALLLLGRVKEGFRAYDRRWGTGRLPNLNPGLPPWTGDALSGRTLLIRCEQGMSECLQFFRLVDLIEGGRVVVEAPPELAPILRASHLASDVVGRGEPLPKADCWAPLLSVPRLLKIDAGSIPDDVPYLRSDPSLFAEWRERLGPGPKIGIAWHGGEGLFDGVSRSIPLAAFAPLAAVPGLQLVSLQKGEGRREIDTVPFPVQDHSDWMDEGPGAFLDTAVVMRECALIVTSGTAIAHLAGALGRPCWTVLPEGGDWRFGWHPSESPWYPTMECLRKPSGGAWIDVFEHIARRLDALRRGHDGALTPS